MGDGYSDTYESGVSLPPPPESDAAPVSDDQADEEVSDEQQG